MNTPTYFCKLKNGETVVIEIRIGSAKESVVREKLQAKLIELGFKSKLVDWELDA
jgi:hypothetical protein